VTTPTPATSMSGMVTIPMAAVELSVRNSATKRTVDTMFNNAPPATTRERDRARRAKCQVPGLMDVWNCR
jgi:hypothetical protein